MGVIFIISGNVRAWAEWALPGPVPSRAVTGLVHGRSVPESDRRPPFTGLYLPGRPCVFHTSITDAPLLTGQSILY